jgi:hypothetical protein
MVTVNASLIPLAFTPHDLKTVPTVEFGSSVACHITATNCLLSTATIPCLNSQHQSYNRVEVIKLMRQQHGPIFF